MLIDTSCIMGLTDAARNFSQYTKKVDENGSVLIIKNNKPGYITMPFAYSDFIQAAEDIAKKLAEISDLEHRIRVVEEGRTTHGRALERLPVWREKLIIRKNELVELEKHLVVIHKALTRPAFNDDEYDGLDEL